MSKIDRWLDKTDQLFLLSPSFYTLLSGALIGAAINLLTSLIFIKEASSIYIWLAIISLLCSSGLMAYISLILEDLRSNAGTDTDTLRRKVSHRRRKLYSILGISVICLIAGGYLLIREL